MNEEVSLVTSAPTIDQSQRDSGSKPKVARNELPWGTWRKTNNPNGVAARRLKPDATPLGLKTIWSGTQGSSFLATLGWKTQSLWDCKTGGFSNVPPEFPFDRNFRKALPKADTCEAEDSLQDFHGWFSLRYFALYQIRSGVGSAMNCGLFRKCCVKLKDFTWPSTNSTGATAFLERFLRSRVVTLPLG